MVPVHQQSQRWTSAGCFEAMAHDLRKLLRIMSERDPNPSATILDARTMRSTPESGARGGYDGHKKTKGSKVHSARCCNRRLPPGNWRNRPSSIGDPG
jgi:hypothetical protein